jgi:hypothetical protein
MDAVNQISLASSVSDLCPTFPTITCLGENDACLLVMYVVPNVGHLTSRADAGYAAQIM